MVHHIVVTEKFIITIILFNTVKALPLIQLPIEVDPENSKKEGTESPTLPPPPLSGHAGYSILSVFLMQSKVKLTFRKIELKSIL